MKTIIKILFFILPLNLLAQWDSVPSNTTNSLNDLTFISLDTGFVVGNNGEMLRTIDGGISWNKINNSLTYNLNTIHFPSKMVGYTNGLKTVNGGTTWDSLSVINNEFVNAVYFINDTIGFWSGPNGYCGKTTNGGTTWNTQIIFPFSQVWEKIEFTSDSIGYIVGWYGGNILKTVDQGNSWFQVYNEHLYSIKFPTPDTGYAVGNGQIIKTTDAGNSWTILSSGIPFIKLNEIYCLNNNLCYAVGYSGTILKTIDGGQNWTQENSGTVENLNSIFCTENSCFVVGDNGIILKTSLVSTAISSIDKSENIISVFPNPSNSILTIDLSLNFNQSFKLAIYNSLGEKIIINTLTNKTSNIDLSSYANGVYFYEITSDKLKIKNGKIIKQ